VPAALLPLARPEGGLIILPFAVYYAIEVLGLGRQPLTVALARLRPGQAALVLSPLLGGAAYLAFMWLATGNALEMIQAMTGYVSAHSLSYILHPVELAQALGQWPLAIHGFTNSIIDRAVFLGFLLLLAPLFRRVHPALAVYALAVGLLNVVSGTFMSYSRYILLAFPIFIAAAVLLTPQGALPASAGGLLFRAVPGPVPGHARAQLLGGVGAVPGSPPALDRQIRIRTRA
jgi:hypothetical protein